MESIECFRCTTRSDDLIFVPIEGTDFGIYLCPTCHLTAGPSPAEVFSENRTKNSDGFWDDAEIISMYTDDMAVSDGVLIDLEKLGVKAEHRSLLINRMTSHLFHQLRNMIAGMHETVEDPVLAAELEATLKTKLFFAHDADGDGFLITLPGGCDDNALWLVKNEVGGYTAMSASDY